MCLVGEYTRGAYRSEGPIISLKGVEDEINPCIGLILELPCFLR